MDYKLLVMFDIILFVMFRGGIQRKKWTFSGCNLVLTENFSLQIHKFKIIINPWICKPIADDSHSGIFHQLENYQNKL